MAASTTGIRRNAVGVDGSESSAAALKWAIRLAKAMGSQVIAVYAIDIPVYLLEPYDVPIQFDEDWRAAVKTGVEDRGGRPLKGPGVRDLSVMGGGRAASVVAAGADRENADVIVVGRRGRGGVAELLLGSASHELVLHSRRPVMVVSAKA